jgi:hypothetical protein
MASTNTRSAGSAVRYSAASTQATLAAHKREVATQLEQERLELLDQRLLELRLRVLVLEAEELEHVRLLELLLGGDGVFGLGHRSPA